MPDFAAQRANMVDTQVRTGDVTDLRLIEAMRAVRRERFVPPENQAIAYREGCLPVGHGRVLLDPRCFARLAQLAEIEPGDIVLDVGCATGYSTAVLARLAAHVVGLEEHPDLAAAAMAALAGVSNAEVVCGPLARGWPARAPYGVIFLNGAVEERPDALLEQLADGGRLVCVLRENGEGLGHGCLFVRSGGALSWRAAFDATVPLLPGFAKTLGFVF